jgi:hypothetical protein
MNSLDPEISPQLREELRERLLQALNGSKDRLRTKEAVRSLHEGQRRERAQAEAALLSRCGRELLSYFANGSEIEPTRIKPTLVIVDKSDSVEGNLFRMATLLWSVPVSRGYGRRLRYLIIDQNNRKLIGLLALGDPVFNLRCRDQWIGWDLNQRVERLAFVLDAYVLGSVPPYSMLLGSKLVGALVASSEIRQDFRQRYARKEGLISGRRKDPYLVLVTTTSALGRSSVYNRLRLAGLVDFQRIGVTDGWGHFLVSDELFKQLRLILKAHGDAYYDNYKYGEGPSWRLRALRKACELLNIDGDLLRHGIQREAYGIPLATNWREILLGGEHQPHGFDQGFAEIGSAALQRWVVPRAEKNFDWLNWQQKDVWDLITKYVTGLSDYEAKVSTNL